MSTPLFPSEWSKIWIRGTFINLDGSPMAGQVSFAANVTGKTMVASAAKKLIAARPLAVTLDGAGYFQIQIPATNDPDITPLNFTYTVAEPTGRTYSITVPWNTATLSAPGDPLDGQQVIDLTSVVPSPGASGGVGQLLRGVGIQSIVNNPSGGLLVTYTDGASSVVSIPDAVKGDKGDPGEPGPASTVPGPQGPPGEVSAAQLASAIAALPFRADNTTTTGAAVGKVPAVTAVDGQGVPSFGLFTPAAGGGAPSSPLAPATPLDLPGYDGNRNMGHPSVLFTPEGFAGHRWWMAVTPYPDAARENPSIYWSDNGIDWTAHPSNPIFPQSAATGIGYHYNSDTHLIRVGTELWMYWRTASPPASVPPNGKNIILRKRSTDGVTWSATETVLEDTSQEVSLNSPVVEQEADGTFSMWAVDYSVSPPVINRRTSANGLSGWSSPTACVIPAGLLTWHIDVKRVGGTYHMLHNAADGRQGDQLYYLTSTDGITWTGNIRVPAILAGAGTFPHDRLYRSCLVPRQGVDGRFDVYATLIRSTTNPETWRIGLFRDTPLPMPAAQALDTALNRDRVAAIVGSDPRWVAGDGFGRADNTSGLGTSSLGAAWTTLAGTPQISGGMAYAPSTSSRAYLGDQGLADVVVACDYFQLGDAWIMFRIVDDSNWLRVGADNLAGRVCVEKRVAGTISRLFTGGTSNIPLRTGDRLTVRAVGTKVSVFRNTLLVTEQTITDFTAATKHGLALGSGGGKMKNFAIGKVA